MAIRSVRCASALMAVVDVGGLERRLNAKNVDVIIVANWVLFLGASLLAFNEKKSVLDVRSVESVLSTGLYHRKVLSVVTFHVKPVKVEFSLAIRCW